MAVFACHAECSYFVILIGGRSPESKDQLRQQSDLSAALKVTERLRSG